MDAFGDEPGEEREAADEQDDGNLQVHRRGNRRKRDDLSDDSAVLVDGQLASHARLDAVAVVVHVDQSRPEALPEQVAETRDAHQEGKRCRLQEHGDEERRSLRGLECVLVGFPLEHCLDQAPQTRLDRDAEKRNHKLVHDDVK